MLIEEISKTCMTTAFLVWCHIACLRPMRASKNIYLNSTLRPKLESGEILGGTGIGNFLKFSAGLLMGLSLRATKTDGGYMVSGTLPQVSNLSDNYYFCAISEFEGK